MGIDLAPRVTGRVFAVEQAFMSEDRRSGADRGDPLAVLYGIIDRFLNKVGFLQIRSSGNAARKDDRVKAVKLYLVGCDISLNGDTAGRRTSTVVRASVTSKPSANIK